MQEIISCPSCKRKLQVPEGLIGQDVQCPTCGATFTARIGGPVPPGAANRYDEPPRNRWNDEESERDRERDRRYGGYEGRRDLMPHRGSAVLTLGIVSIITCTFCPLIAAITGPIAWTMGNTDMTEFRAGRMDPDGESTTNAGRICGIIGTILGVLGLVGCGLYFLFIAMVANRF